MVTDRRMIKVDSTQLTLTRMLLRYRVRLH